MGRKLKTCFIGDSTVGKTSVILRVIEGCFKENTVGTVGVDFKSQKRKVAGKDVNVQLWDTTGQDKFRTVTKNFFRGSDGIMLTFSMVSDKSAQSLEFWMKELRDHLDPQVPIIILGNKCDLQAELSQQAQDMLKKLQQREKLRLFIGSAKSGVQIKEAYEALLVQALKYNLKKDPHNSLIINDSYRRSLKKQKGCC